MGRVRDLSEVDIYHVIMRGVGRQIIFEDIADRERYLSFLSRAVRENSVVLYAWCLMGNHAHLLVRGTMENVSEAMRFLNSQYALYFNKRHDHVGHLFQGRFKSKAIESEGQFLTVLRYIHQNPEHAGLGPAKYYRWCSYREYLGSPGLCHTKPVLKIFGSRQAFEAFHCEAGEAESYMEPGSIRAISDEGIRRMAEDAIGAENLRTISSMSKPERDKLLKTLRETGLSIRQIERLTGLGRNIISRAR